MVRRDSFRKAQASFLGDRPLAPPGAASRRDGFRVSLVLALLCGLFAVTAGCDESVDAIVGSDVPFTVWGFLDAAADTQYVRVFEIIDTLIPDVERGIDARVSSMNLTTGERREWTYEAVLFDSLITGHFFWSPFRAQHEHRYRLEVVRSDGEMSGVEVLVPPYVDFEVQADLDNTLVPVQIRGEVPNLVGLRVVYHAVNVPPAQAWPSGTPVAPPVQLPVIVSYDDLVERIPSGWRFAIDMERDFDIVQRVYRINCLISDPEESAPDVWLRKMQFSALVADSAWAPPGDVFDPNVLSVPGTFSNIENGYGFFGAGMAIGRVWTPSTETSLAAGYDFQRRCTGLFPQNVPECWNPPVPCMGDVFRGFEGFVQSRTGRVPHRIR